MQKSRTFFLCFAAGSLMLAVHGAFSRSDERSNTEAPVVLPANASGIGRIMPEFKATDFNGKKWTSQTVRGSVATVFVMTSTSCPVSKRYQTRLGELANSYEAKGVKFVLVNPLMSETKQELKSAIQEFKLKSPYIQSMKLSETLGGQSTAETLVYDRTGTLVYRGAIDDQYGIGYAKAAPKANYLSDAINAVIAGELPEIACTSAPGCPLEMTPSKPATPTYYRQISRIMERNCVECHHEGGVAPFTLDTLKNVVDRAPSIKLAVKKGIMPPWFAADEPAGKPSKWANCRKLSNEERTDLLAWIDGDKKAGSPKDAPIKQTFNKEWQMGKPDQIFQIEKPFSVPATGVVEYQYSLVKTGLTEDKYLSAVEIAPTQRRVVHHVLVFVIPKERLEKNKVGITLREQLGFFAGYVPGSNFAKFPPGHGIKLPAGSGLLFQIHYTPNGGATQDQVRMGVQYAKVKPKTLYEVMSVARFGLKIPANDPAHEEIQSFPITRDTVITAFMPHMHVRGKAFKYELIRPDGTKETLLDVPRYDFNWQLRYVLQTPLKVEKGSKILCTAVYDNSDKNPFNPNPNKVVRWGDQTFDEMFLGYFQYYVVE